MVHLSEMCENENCIKLAIKIEALTLELQNCCEQKAWLESQTPKLEKQVRELKINAAEKEHAALSVRRKFAELEKKMDADRRASQHQLKKLDKSSKDRDRTIEELNAALRISPKRKPSLDTEPINKPMFTKNYENGVLSFDLPECQELQNRAELKFAKLKDNTQEEKRIEAVCTKLSRFLGGSMPSSTGVSQLESIVYEISSKDGDLVSHSKAKDMENEVRSLRSRCGILEDLLNASESISDTLSDATKDSAVWLAKKL